VRESALNSRIYTLREIRRLGWTGNGGREQRNVQKLDSRSGNTVLYCPDLLFPSLTYNGREKDCPAGNICPPYSLQIYISSQTRNLTCTP